MIINTVSQYLQYRISPFRELKYLIKVTLKILDITAIQNTNISHTEYQYIFPQTYWTIFLIVYHILMQHPHKEKYICILHIETFYTNKANWEVSAALASTLTSQLSWYGGRGGGSRPPLPPSRVSTPADLGVVPRSVTVASTYLP